MQMKGEAVLMLGSFSGFIAVDMGHAAWGSILLMYAMLVGLAAMPNINYNNVTPSCIGTS